MEPCKYIIKISNDSYFCYSHDEPSETKDKKRATRFNEFELAQEEVTLMGIGEIKAVPYN
ncbi:hypothetical protein CPT_MarsHill_229 [Staphylococcus phage MarsHill]|nr:hypothetical protein CPT_MarsHill_229 [Staphylococcus phage MarsHill]QQO92881.1 hypothetical protein CPT_Madawaska_232 [Staphylococcus phage Madawaska]